MNSILLYVGHEMFSGMIPWSWKPFTGEPIHTNLLFVFVILKKPRVLETLVLVVNQPFHADPDPAIFGNEDMDPGTVADPDPGKNVR